MLLTPREKRLLRRFAQGRTDRSIARELCEPVERVAVQRETPTRKTSDSINGSPHGSGGQARLAGFRKTDAAKEGGRGSGLSHRGRCHRGICRSVRSRRSGPLIQANGPYLGKHGLHTKGSFPAKVFICRNICPLVQLACAGRISLAEFMARDNWLFLISIAWILALLSTFVLILIL